MPAASAPVHVLANMIVPITFIFGWIMAVALVPIVVVETLVVGSVARRALRSTIVGVGVANVVSTFLGVCAAGILESQGPSVGSRAWETRSGVTWYLVLGVAFACSLVVEALVLRFGFAWQARRSGGTPSPSPARTWVGSLLANAASYGGLVVWTLVMS